MAATADGGAITQVQTVNGILDVQKAVCQVILANTYFARTKIQVLPENALDIVTGIKKEIGKLGIVGMVMTPQMQYMGKFEGRPVWSLDDIQVSFTEVPVTNRGRANASTALDAALQAAESLNEAGLLLKDIRQVEDQGYVVVTVTCSSAVHFAYAKVVKQTATAGDVMNEPPTP